jgi:protoporphyrinogen oxidase
MRIGILGAGVSGLALGKMLHASHDVELLERKDCPGGIARAVMVGEIPYHQVGGHCLNSSLPGVMEFVFGKVLPQSRWRELQRISSILFHGRYVSYPIEQAIPEIADFDEELAIRMVEDFFRSRPEEASRARTLDAWLKKTFGNSLAEEYFLPYNRKVWNTEPSRMSPAWTQGKLPIPDRKIFFRALLGKKDGKIPHASFFYPQSNSQNAFLDALASGLRVAYNYPVESVGKTAQQWLINGEKRFDVLVSTLPLDIMPSILPMSAGEMRPFGRLKRNGIRTVLYAAQPREDTWTYFPDKELAFHRAIGIGNFLEPKRPYAIVESIGGHSFAKIREDAKKVDFLLEPVAENFSEYAYPVFDREAEKNRREALRVLDARGVYALGRFAEWEYYNMDVCMYRAMQVAASIRGQGGAWTASSRDAAV